MPRVETPDWLVAVRSATAAGFTNFVTLMAVDDDGLALWLRLRNPAGEALVLRTAAGDAVPSLIGLLPQAAWYEREAAEGFGITFLDHGTAPLLLPANALPTMPTGSLLASRQLTPWPGEKEPGGAATRRRQLPPGVRS